MPSFFNYYLNAKFKGIERSRKTKRAYALFKDNNGFERSLDREHLIKRIDERSGVSMSIVQEQTALAELERCGG